ncbi:MAG: hypothetical protein HN366_17005 [Deltaproteobacteria bacterium]|nr:hypothetical protein [Deltaproteobacteria bacterium]
MKGLVFHTNGNYILNTMGLTKNSFSLLGKIAYSILAGVLGAILIVLFFSTFLNIFSVLKFIPWIIALNTAITGYSLLDKARDLLRYKQISAMISGILNVLITYSILILISVNIMGENLFNSGDLMVFLIIGIVCSELGAVLAIQYFKLKK